MLWAVGKETEVSLRRPVDVISRVLYPSLESENTLGTCVPVSLGHQR